jgi:hypothetical protein
MATGFSEALVDGGVHHAHAALAEEPRGPVPSGDELPVELHLRRGLVGGGVGFGVGGGRRALGGGAVVGALADGLEGDGGAVEEGVGVDGGLGRRRGVGVVIVGA